MPVVITGGKASRDMAGTATGASGTCAHVEGAATNVASTQNSHAEGQQTTASGSQAHAEGNSTLASGNNSHASGANTTAGGNSSYAGGDYGNASRANQFARGASTFGASGDSQYSAFPMSRQTNTATPALLTFNGNGTITLTFASTNVLTIPVNRGHRFRLEVIARRSDVAGDFAAWTIVGTIVRGASGDARFISTPTVTTDADAGASAWTVGVSIDAVNATNNYLAITVTGEAAKTIRWVGRLETVEVG